MSTVMATPTAARAAEASAAAAAAANSAAGTAASPAFVLLMTRQFLRLYTPEAVRTGTHASLGRRLPDALHDATCIRS